MKKFKILWCLLLLMVLITVFCVTIAIYNSGAFCVLGVICAFCCFKLMSSAFLGAQLLHDIQKHRLVITLHRLGHVFLLVTIACVLYIANDPANQHIISKSIGIGCLCNCILSFALRNLLWFWVTNKQKAQKPTNQNMVFSMN